MYKVENLWYYLGDYDRLSNKCMFQLQHNLVKNIPIELSKSKFLIRRIHSPYWQVGVIKEFIESLDLPASLDWNFLQNFTFSMLAVLIQEQEIQAWGFLKIHLGKITYYWRLIFSTNTTQTQSGILEAYGLLVSLLSINKSKIKAFSFSCSNKFICKKAIISGQSYYHLMWVYRFQNTIR